MRKFGNYPENLYLAPMIHIQTKQASAELKKRLTDLKDREMPFASALTLTKTAQFVKKDIEGAILRNFSNPTPYTQRSVFLKPATKTNQTALVWIKEWGDKGTPAAKYLLPNVQGGERPSKPSEKLLQRSGVMKSGETWTPGSGARKNAYGNIAPSEIVKVLSATSSLLDPYQNRTERSKKRNKGQASIFFAQFGNTRGVFKKGPRNSISMILRFSGETSPPTHRVRFPFVKIADGSAKRHYDKAFESAVQQVIATRR